MHGRDVGIQTANDARYRKGAGSQSLGHVWSLLKSSLKISTPGVGVLKTGKVPPAL
jgi:hypothetical protein